MKQTSSRIKKTLYITTGTISLGLGMPGIFIPVLPTTPFLLLMAFCYVRSSKRLYSWLINHKFFGSYIYNYMQYKAVNNLHIRIFLLAVGIAVSWHILSLKSLESVIKDES